MVKGIYKITNNRTGEVYIGQAKNIKSRKNRHFREMAQGKHHNSGMQNDHNLGDTFSFDILEELPNATKADLYNKESQYIKKYNSFREGYNQTPGGAMDQFKGKYEHGGGRLPIHKYKPIEQPTHNVLNYCSECGNQLDVNSNYCSNCGVKIIDGQDNKISNSQYKPSHSYKSKITTIADANILITSLVGTLLLVGDVIPILSLIMTIMALISIITCIIYIILGIFIEKDGSDTVVIALLFMLWDIAIFFINFYYLNFLF